MGGRWRPLAAVCGAAGCGPAGGSGGRARGGGCGGGGPSGSGSGSVSGCSGLAGSAPLRSALICRLSAARGSPRPVQRRRWPAGGRLGTDSGRVGSVAGRGPPPVSPRDRPARTPVRPLAGTSAASGRAGASARGGGDGCHHPWGGNAATLGTTSPLEGTTQAPAHTPFVLPLQGAVGVCGCGVLSRGPPPPRPHACTAR